MGRERIEQERDLKLSSLHEWFSAQDLIVKRCEYEYYLPSALEATTSKCQSQIFEPSSESKTPAS